MIKGKIKIKRRGRQEKLEYWILDRISKENLSKKEVTQVNIWSSWAWNHVNVWRKSFCGGGKSKCKGPGVGACLEYMRKEVEGERMWLTGGKVSDNTSTLWCWRKTLESPLDCKEIQPVHPKRNQSWIFTGRTDVEAETPILWPPDGKNWLIWKDPDAGKEWRWEEKGVTGWDGWMASPAQCAWVWVNSGSWWGTGKPGVLQSMGPQRVGHDWATGLNWTESEWGGLPRWH